MSNATVELDPADVGDLRYLAADLRRFVRHYANEIPNYIHQTQATATMIDVVADRIERRTQ